MPIDQFSQSVVNQLNEPDSANEWISQPHMPNKQPWVRIYRQDWLAHWHPHNVQHAPQNPIVWFEIKCRTNHEAHNGHPPHNIYVPIDEKSFNVANVVNWEQIQRHPGRFLPNPDIYGDFLDHLSQCYRANVRAWRCNVGNAIDAYREGRHFLQGAANPHLPHWVWWEANVRQQLDCCLIVVEHEDEAEVAACANFIKSRAQTIDCAMEAG